MESRETKLVLLPGIYGTGELFSDFIDALPREFAARAVHYPNDVCLSYAELLGIVQNEVPASEPYVIVAESFSTPLAIQFAGMNPLNLKGLVLSAGFATSPVRGALQWLSPIMAPLLAHLPICGIGAKILVPESKDPESALARMRVAIASVEPKVMMDRVQSVVGCNALEELGKIKVPVLYLQATRDFLVNPVCLEEMRQVKPEIEVVVMDGPHVILQLMPRQAVEIVADFVRRL